MINHRENSAYISESGLLESSIPDSKGSNRKYSTSLDGAESQIKQYQQIHVKRNSRHSSTSPRNIHEGSSSSVSPREYKEQNKLSFEDELTFNPKLNALSLQLAQQKRISVQKLKHASDKKVRYSNRFNQFLKLRLFFGSEPSWKWKF